MWEKIGNGNYSDLSTKNILCLPDKSNKVIDRDGSFNFMIDSCGNSSRCASSELQKVIQSNLLIFINVIESETDWSIYGK